jgi:hypothetical protein
VEAWLLKVKGCNLSFLPVANPNVVKKTGASCKETSMATAPKTPNPEEKSPIPISTHSSKAIPVTVDNFIRAETDRYFAAVALKEGGFGKFEHRREPMAIDDQTVVRCNRDTLYSGAVFDLDAASVTITLPDAGQRFMSMQVFDEDEYVVEVVYGAGSHTYSKQQIGTRYAMCAVRTLVNPDDPADVEQVHALQDGIKIEQKSTGRFEVPNWDQESQKKVREALLTLGSTLPDSRGMFGAKGQVDPVRRLIGAAMAWGGNPEKDATYLSVTPAQNDGKVIHRLTVKSVPVDGFWSIIVYNKDGYIEPNGFNMYSLNTVTAKKGADGPVMVQFGGWRRQGAKLHTDHAGLELHGPTLSSACRNLERQLEVPSGTTRLVNPRHRKHEVAKRRPVGCRNIPHQLTVGQ